MSTTQKNYNPDQMLGFKMDVNLIDSTGATSGQVPTFNGTTVTWQNGGGGGSPSAPNSSVQYNKSGAFQGDVTFTRNKGVLTNIADSFAAGATSAIQLNPNFLGSSISGAGVTQNTTNGEAGMVTGDFTGVGFHDYTVGIFSQATVGGSHANILADGSASGTIKLDMKDGTGVHAGLTLRGTTAQLEVNGVTWQLPTADGAFGQAIITNGTGGLSFGKPNANAVSLEGIALGAIVGMPTKNELISFNGTTYSVTGAGTVAAVAGAATLNNQNGLVETESLVVAAGAIYTLVLTSSAFSGTSQPIVTATQGTATTGIPYVTSVTPGSGTCTIVVTNIDPAAALNGTILIKYFVF